MLGAGLSLERAGDALMASGGFLESGAGPLGARDPCGGNSVEGANFDTFPTGAILSVRSESRIV